MSWVKVELRQLRCDVCGGPGPAAPTREEAAREAVLVGWSHTGRLSAGDGTWRCPGCSTARRPRELKAADRGGL